jgi:uncharacterized membrane protein YsdA (DUF1294 family)
MTRFIQVWSTITIIDGSEQFHLHFKVGLLPHTLGYRGVNFGTKFYQHKILRHRFKSRMDVVQGMYQRVIYPNLK